MVMVGADDSSLQWDS